MKITCTIADPMNVTIRFTAEMTLLDAKFVASGITGDTVQANRFRNTLAAAIERAMGTIGESLAGEDR